MSRNTWIKCASNATFIERSKNLKYSDKISDILSFFREAQTTFNCAKVDEKAADDETQDLLHSLELDDTLTYYRKADLAKRIAAIRKSRRIAKNLAWINEPIVKWSGDNVAAIKALEKLLGEVRKIEQSQENRIYVPRSEKTEPVMVTAINHANKKKSQKSTK